MDQQKRLLLAIALSFGLTLVFTQLVWKPQAEEAARLAALADAGAPAAAQAAQADAGEAVAPPTMAAAPADGDAGVEALDGGAMAEAPPAPAPVVLPQREVSVARATTALVLTTEGGGIASAELKGTREHVPQELTVAEGYKKLFGGKFAPPEQLNLARPIATVGPQVSLAITGATPLAATQRYAVTEESAGRVVFSTRVGPWEVTKTFSFPDGTPKEKDPSPYMGTLAVVVKNVSAAAASGELVLGINRAINPANEQAPSMFGGIGNQASVLCLAGEDLHRKTPSGSGGFLSCGTPGPSTGQHEGAIHFVGLDQQYFLSALWPLDAALTGHCDLTATDTERIASMAAPLTLQAGESKALSFGVFLGPKDLELLTRVGQLPAPGAEVGAVSGFSPGLDKTVDFGMWAFICKALLVFMRLFHGLTGNWGLAIILLTIMVKIIVLPLTHKAMVNAEKMKKMQPQMDAIRKKYPDDAQRQMAEMQKMGLDPFASLTGCLPMLLQMPIWIALFTTLRTSYELYGEPFFGVWSDLTAKDPTYLLPLALGITMLITQRLQPQMMEKNQAFLFTWVMPIFFSMLMMSYPAGLALYIFTNNLLSIAQQFALRKYLERTGQAAPNVKAGAKS